MTEPVTHKLDVPGAVLCFDVRQSEPRGGPVLLMIGSPMGAAGFGTLATHFTDRTVVTYDPRGVERSERTDAELGTEPVTFPGGHGGYLGGEYGETGEPEAFAARLRVVLDATT
jgi:hypothetical protein